MSDDKIIKIALSISLLGHCFLLGMPVYLPLSLKNPKDITVKIDIKKPTLLPKINRLGDEKKIKEIKKEPIKNEEDSIDKLKEKVVKQPEIYEEKIKVANPEKEAIFRYQDIVKQKIQEVRKYPLWAKKQEIEGEVNLIFLILSNGDVQDIVIKHSSGFNILDKEAISTVKRASPFLPIPKEIHKSSLEMEVSIVFNLN